MTYDMSYAVAGYLISYFMILVLSLRRLRRKIQCQIFWGMVSIP